MKQEKENFNLEEKVEDLYKLAKKTMRIYGKKGIPFFVTNEDLVQDLVCHTYEKLKGYDDGKGAFSTYVMTVMKNRILIIQNFYNRNKRKGELLSFPFSNVTNVANDGEEANLEEMLLNTGTPVAYSSQNNFNDEEFNAFLSRYENLLNKDVKEMIFLNMSIKEYSLYKGFSRQNMSSKILKNVKKIQKYLIENNLFEKHRTEFFEMRKRRDEGEL